MCGIAGFKLYGKTNPTKQVLESILLSLQDRGEDATGMACLLNTKHGPRLFVEKKDCKAKEFIETKGWKEAVEVLTKSPNVISALFHTRATTQGTEKNQKNNHPVFSKSGTAIVHNGIIRNDDKLIAELKWKREGEVDSEALLAIVESAKTPEACELMLRKVEGSYAIGAISEMWPDKIIVARNGSPLAVGFDLANDIFYFASLPHFIQEAHSGAHRGLTVIHSISVGAMKDDTGFIFDSKGLSKELDVKREWMRSQAYGAECGWEWCSLNKCYVSSHVHPDDCTEVHRYKKKEELVSGDRAYKKILFIPLSCWRNIPNEKRKEIKNVLRQKSVSAVYVQSAKTDNSNSPTSQRLLPVITAE